MIKCLSCQVYVEPRTMYDHDWYGYALCGRCDNQLFSELYLLGPFNIPYATYVHSICVRLDGGEEQHENKVCVP